MNAPLDQLAIVVVTWQSATDVGPLLASLAPALAAGAELVVVENASGDATPALVRAAAPAARIIVNDTNRGFAAAANQGFAASARPYVLFLNPDTVFGPDALPRALAALVAAPGVAVLGCRTLNEDGTPQPTVDRFHTVGGLLRDALRGGRLWHHRPRGTSPTTTGEVDWVYGSFLLCRRAPLAALGGFDEAYGMYGEDLDLCHRVRAAGYAVLYTADTTIVHRGNRSGSRRFGARRDLEVLKGTLRFFRRRRGAGAERAFRAVAGASFAAKALAESVRALAPGAVLAPARARAYARMAWLCLRGDPAAATRRARAGCGPGRRLG